jgi:hypothetical protein
VTLGDRNSAGEGPLGVTGAALVTALELPGSVDAAVFGPVDAVVFVLVDDELALVVRGGVTR